jgi:plasmid stabilization system protein ParE
MIKVEWSDNAVSDLGRLYDFLVSINKQAAAKTVQSLSAAPNKLVKQPRIGERLEQYDPREIRRIIVAQYEVRYEIKENTLYVLRIWHTKEQR